MRVYEDGGDLSADENTRGTSFRAVNAASRDNAAAKMNSSRWRKIPRTCWSLRQIDESIDPQIIVLSRSAGINSIGLPPI